MKQAFDSTASREVWSARYEHLRAGWLAQELAWGQALFIRRGMVAWTEAWSAAEPIDWSPRPGPVVPELVPQGVALGGRLQRQLTRELVNLILHCQQEVSA
jgi:hypothetical protein